MTVIVSVKINDGIIMASDSASTFAIGQIYLTADKIVNLVKGLSIGVMVTGAGRIGSESIATLLKDLRCRLDGSTGHAWKLDTFRDSRSCARIPV
jgi:ATP-dependent protease HslVU (ClpYQ) peptidase subunit